MNLELLHDFYKKNNLSENDYFEAKSQISSLNEVATKDIDTIDVLTLDKLIVYLVQEEKNTVQSFVVMMRYFRVIDRKDLFIHLTKYTGMLGVIDNIIDRLEKLHGKEFAKQILGNYQAPYLGVSPYELPNYAKNLVELLEKNLKKEEVNKVLAGNNHGIPEKSLLPEKIEYENSKSLEEYLKGRHDRKILELEKHLKENTVWFEQIITKEVIDFVKSNQEVLSAKLVGDKLYVTKIPYDTLSYLNEIDKTRKRYFACHCPFAREAIKAGRPDLSKRFCYCSAGFAKYPFEVILGQNLDVSVIDTVLGENHLCQFVIDLKNVDFKR
ncbi:MAG: hypothetical protein JEZ05_03885 [Tenericutes bacterium]|nr:hypothetical protein [Mycoplasmatota bacterium]